jgi:hypothetical protein
MQHALASPSHLDANIRWSHRKIPLSYARHRCGRVAWTPEPQSIPVESKLEADLLAYLMVQGDLLAVHSQPFTLSYQDAGITRRYTPDFLLVFDRLTRQLVRWGFAPWTVVEIKPATDLERHIAEVKRRLEAVHAQLGLAAVCLTETHLPTGRA